MSFLIAVALFKVCISSVLRIVLCMILLALSFMLIDYIFNESVKQVFL